MNYPELTDAYRHVDLACAKLYYRLHSEKMFERAPLVPTPEVGADIRSELAAARKMADALAAPSPVFSIMKQHFQDFLDSIALETDLYFTRPADAILPFAYKMTYYADIDSRPDDEKTDILIAQLSALSQIVPAIHNLAASADDGVKADLNERCAFIQDCFRYYAENVSRSYPALSAGKAAALSRVLLDGCAALETLKASRIISKPEADDESRCLAGSEAHYRSVLHDTLGVELDELLAWHRQEIQKTQDEVLEIAARLPISKTPQTMSEVNETLRHHAGSCDTPGEMFTRMQSYLNRARIAAREYVWFPEEVCRLEPTPYPLLPTFPWGGYCDGDGVQRPITGKAFLNVPNFRALTDGWLKMQALHEAYPGHHIQYVRSVTDALPETLKVGAKYIPLLEGTAHRTEHVFEFVFEEDPFYPLFIAYRRLHTAIRIQSDLWLQYERRPIRECVQLYMDELDFDHTTARGQVKAQESMEGYFTCYYYGMKKIADFEAKYGKDKKSFTELLFSCGKGSLEHLEAYLQLDEMQRQSYCRDFRSLLMDPLDEIR